MTNISKAIQIKENGSVEKMEWIDIELPSLKNTQVRVKHTYVGINYIDTYHRSGLYPLSLPTGLGMEGAGVVTDIGDEVQSLQVGDRVCYVMQLGSYCSVRNIEEKALVKIPDTVNDMEAAAVLLKGMTVEYLVERLFQVNSSHTVLFHAIAGGVGLIACQWLKNIGARVIGTVGSEEKKSLALDNGCDEVILYKNENFADKINELTEGKGVDVVFDGVGKDTALMGLDCLKPLGMMVVFGNSSGNCPPIDPGLLASKGSLFFTRPTLMNYGTKREDLLHSSNRVFQMLSSNKIKLSINSSYELSDVKRAHFDLESRITTGSIIMKNNY